MTSGTSGMGMHKHGVSGRSGKSPKMRLAEKLKAERDEKKPRQFKMKKSIKDLFK